MNYIASIFSYHFSRRLFQIVICALLLIPLGMGITGMLFGLKGLSWVLGIPMSAIEPNIDSDFRFLAAIFFGMGIIIAWILPRIEKNTALFRIVAGAICLGGIARIASALIVGSPNMRTWLLVAVELTAPLFIWWQWQLSKAAKQ